MLQCNTLDSRTSFNWYTIMGTDSILQRDHAYQRIQELILSASLDSSQPLSERKLAETLGIGRTPVREAIRRLTREGVVEVRPARGTYIRQLTMDEIEEIYEARMGIEGMAAFLAGERGPTAKFSRFRKLFGRMSKCPDGFDPAESHKSGQAFHVEIFRAARNRPLLEIYETLRLRHQVALGLPQIHDHVWIRQSVAEHLAILDAIERRASSEARELICNHLAKALAIRSQIFDDLAKTRQPSIALRNFTDAP